MSEAHRLKLRDVVAVFRLIGDIRLMGADPNKWRPHMVQELRKLLHAQVVVSSEVHFRQVRAGAMRMIDIGWGSDEDGKTWQIHTERDDAKPEDFWLAVGQEPPRPATAEAPVETVVPVIPAQRFREGSTFILSQCALPHLGTVDQLGLHRAWGDEPFTRPQHRLVRLLHLELGRLWKSDALRRAEDPTSDLPPRLQQTLAELMGGLSEKEIASKLGLSRHTIHNYVKALHQRLGVSSRGELLARVGQTQKDFIPRLSIDNTRKE